MKTIFSRLFILLLLTLVFFRCSSDESAPESQNPADGEGESGGRALMVVQLKDGDPAIGGHNALARAGDYLIANERVRFVIQGEGRARSWIPYGGTLIDADIVRPDGTGNDQFGELSVITGFIRAFRPDSFEVISDGSDGLTAQLRVHGRDWGVPLIDFLLKTKPMELEVRLDYILEAGDNALKIITTVTNRGDAKPVDLGDGLVWGNLLKVLTPGFGWGLEGLSAHGDFTCQMAVGDGVAYGFSPLEGMLKIPIDQADILPFMGAEDSLRTGESMSYPRIFIVDEDLEGVRRRLAELNGEKRNALKVDIALADEQDAAEKAELVVLDSDGIPVSMAYLPSQSVEFELESGSYTLVTVQEGRPGGEPVVVSIGEEGASSSITIPATGRIRYSIGGDHFDGAVREGLPCRITLQAGAEADIHARVIRRIYTATGKGTFLIEPGEYTITAARGYEYEYIRQSITIGAAATAEFGGQLRRVVDTSGWLAGDLHVHSERSIDATIPVEERLVHLAAVGLEAGPITDHDTITDIDHLVDGLGLRDYLRVFTGCEVSPPWGHTNGIFMSDRDDRPLYFGVPWYKGYDEDGLYMGGMTMPEIHEAMRREFDTKIIQINHPRTYNAYFNSINYNPALGFDALEEGAFDPNFDNLELLHMNGIDVALEQILYDWYSLLNQGVYLTGVGVSDTHTDDSPGDARTYYRTGEDDPNAATDECIIAAFKGHHALACSGPFIRAGIGGNGPGDTVVGAGPYDLSVEVQAPSWMPVDWVRVIVNGEQETEEALTGAEVLRYSGTITIDPRGADFWVVVLSGAPEKTLDPVSPGQHVLTIANPIFVDVDGDGFEAPGLQAVSYDFASTNLIY